MIKTVLVTVSDDRFGRKDGRYSEIQDRITDLFTGYDPNLLIAPYKWDDIQNSQFYLENKTLLDNTDMARNGVAYKPYAILNEFRNLADGEFLIYTDCSADLWKEVEPFDRFDLNIIQNLCEKNNDILTAFIKWDMKNIAPGDLGIATHKNFTLNRCMDKMGLRFYEDAYQCASGMICIRKTPQTLILAQEWLKWNCIDECCALGWADKERDTSFWKAESYAPTFGEPGYKMGHRHDQSILGLLLARTNQKFVDILYNQMNPLNFLQFCRPDIEYDFIDSLPRLVIGDIVENKQGTEMNVFDIEDGKYIVGQSTASCYATKRENLKKVETK